MLEGANKDICTRGVEHFLDKWKNICPFQTVKPTSQMGDLDFMRMQNFHALV